MQFGDLKGGQKFNYVVNEKVDKLMKIHGLLITHAGHVVNAVSLSNGKPFFISDMREVKPPYRK